MRERIRGLPHPSPSSKKAGKPNAKVHHDSPGCSAGCRPGWLRRGGCRGTAEAEPQAKPAEHTEPPKPTPSPDARFSGSCDYTLPENIMSDNYKLIGDVDGTNTGNVGAKVKVTIKWQQMGYDPITESETVKLRPGQSKTLRFNKTVSGVVIDRIQSFEMNHGFGDLCKYDAVIVDTFGQPQS